MTPKQQRAVSIIATVLKCLLGVFFIVSALSKFVSIDNFNIYIFSFGILSFRLAVIIGWLAVSTELLLGVALLLNRHHRLVSLLCILMLIAFSLFLVYAWFVGRTDSCHCMGDLLPFDPLRSVMKNAVLLLFALFIWRYADAEWRPRWWLVLPLVILAQAFIVICGFRGVIRMNFFDLQYSSTLMALMAAVAVLATFKFSKRLWVEILMCLVPYVSVFILCTAACLAPVRGTIPVNGELLDSTISAEGPLGYRNLTEGHKVLCFYSKGCQYCKRTSETLSMIQKRHDLPSEAFVTAFPTDTVHGLERFYDSPYAERFSISAVPADDFLRITYGNAPLVVLLDDGVVVDTYGSGYISESKIVDFLTR
ncbi:MAG: DoxX family membrane protein [Bacteroidales bacterium]|nr:DoxX family membrane protein [Bacteroidales bacterium]